jgi:hypothetical protein
MAYDNYPELDKMRLQTLDALQSDPEIAPDLYRIVRKKFPNAQVPDKYLVDERAAAIAEEKVNTERTRIKALEDQVAQDRFLREQSEKHSKLRGAPHYLSEDDIKAVEKIMVDEQIPNYETAAKFYRATQQPLSPGGHGKLSRASKGPDFRDSLRDRSSEMVKNLSNQRSAKDWARNRAQEAWSEIESGEAQII